MRGTVAYLAGERWRVRSEVREQAAPGETDQQVGGLRALTHRIAPPAESPEVLGMVPRRVPREDDREVVDVVVQDVDLRSIEVPLEKVLEVVAQRRHLAREDLVHLLVVGPLRTGAERRVDRFAGRDEGEREVEVDMGVDASECELERRDVQVRPAVEKDPP